MVSSSTPSFLLRRDLAHQLAEHPDSWERPAHTSIWRENPTHFRGCLLRHLAQLPDPFRRFEAVLEALDREGLPHTPHLLAHDLLRHVAFRQPDHLTRAMNHPEFLALVELTGRQVEAAARLLAAQDPAQHLAEGFRAAGLDLLNGNKNTLHSLIPLATTLAGLLEEARSATGD